MKGVLYTFMILFPALGLISCLSHADCLLIKLPFSGVYGQGNGTSIYHIIHIVSCLGTTNSIDCMHSLFYTGTPARLINIDLYVPQYCSTVTPFCLQYSYIQAARALSACQQQSSNTACMLAKQLKLFP